MFQILDFKCEDTNSADLSKWINHSAGITVLFQQESGHPLEVRRKAPLCGNLLIHFSRLHGSPPHARN